MSAKGVKEKPPAPPKAAPSDPPANPEIGDRGDREIHSPPAAGFVFVAAGILLMLLSGWPSNVPVISQSASAETASAETASAETASAESPAIVRGVDGDDDIYGEAGGEVFIAGEGDDFIEAKDGTGDLVMCGPGEDVASADTHDKAAADCETVYRS